MKRQLNMKQKLTRYTKTACSLGLLLSSMTALPLQAATTITIGKGAGVQWEGMPFTVSFDASMGSHILYPEKGIAAISDNTTSCLQYSWMTFINGERVKQLAPGVGLVPRATVTAEYTLYDGTTETLTGTIGMGGTKGQTDSGHVITSPVYPSSPRDWCLPPRMLSSAAGYFYKESGPRKVTITGTWVVITDGTQTAQDGISVPRLVAASYSNGSSGNKTQEILPWNIDLRISNLECSVDTPVAISFGAVLHDPTPNAELDRITHPFNISCGQDADQINANINVQFRALTGLYNGNVHQLQLQQGGGYITGEIPGVTSVASCGSSGGVSFDSKQIEIGKITSAENRKYFNNQVVWRLCAGDASLPTGKVNAAAELLVTYN